MFIKYKSNGYDEVLSLWKNSKECAADLLPPGAQSAHGPI